MGACLPVTGWRVADSRVLAPVLLVLAALVLQGFTPVSLAALIWIAGVLLLTSCALPRLPPRAPAIVLFGLTAWVGGMAVLAQGGSPVAVSAWLTAALLPAGYAAYAGTGDKSAAMAALRGVLVLAVVALTVHVAIDYRHGLPFSAALFAQKNSLGAWLALSAWVLAPRWLTAPGHAERVLALAAVGLALFVITLNGSRAVLLALLAGALAFAVLAPARQQRRGLVIGAVVAALAIAAAEWGSGGRMLDSVRAPVAAGLSGRAAAAAAQPELVEQKHLTSLAQRQAIWRSAAGMLEAMPWHGYGPGSYRLEYPRHASPADRSTQQYAHNDPLQLLLEWGYPGVLLALIFAALLVAAALRVRRLAPAPRTEAAGLAAGLAAVAAHSLVSYNFFVPATLVLCGVVAARLTELAATAGRSAPARGPLFSRGGARAAGAAAFVLLTAVTACLAVMDHAYRQGSQALGAGDLAGAAAGFSRSYSAWPSDLALTGLAMTYLAGADAAGDPAQRLALLEQANFCLDEARVRGPLNPLVPLARSEWALRLRGSDSDDAAALADRFLEQALAMNPRFHAARLARARLLSDRGRRREAADVLEAGLGYAFAITSESLVYLDELLRLRSALGRDAGAERILALRAELALKLRV